MVKLYQVFLSSTFEYVSDAFVASLAAAAATSEQTTRVASTKMRNKKGQKLCRFQRRLINLCVQCLFPVYFEL